MTTNQIIGTGILALAISQLALLSLVTSLRENLFALKNSLPLEQQIAFHFRVPFRFLSKSKKQPK